jgi:Swiss Army Knife, 2H phosphoesterase domain/R3H domain
MMAFRESTYGALVAFKRDTERSGYPFPPTLKPRERMLVHQLAADLDLLHVSEGDGTQRHVLVSKPKPSADAEGDLGAGIPANLIAERFFMHGFLGLTGALVNAVALEVEALVPLRFRQRRLARDGAAYHITVLSQAELTSLLAECNHATQQVRASSPTPSATSSTATTSTAQAATPTGHASTPPATSPVSPACSSSSAALSDSGTSGRRSGCSAGALINLQELHAMLVDEVVDDWRALDGLGYARKGTSEAYFRVVEWPSANALRARLGLALRNLHVTVGFYPSDVHQVPKTTAQLLTAEEMAALQQQQHRGAVDQDAIVAGT